MMVGVAAGVRLQWMGIDSKGCEVRVQHHMLDHQGLHEQGTAGHRAPWPVPALTEVAVGALLTELTATSLLSSVLKGIALVCTRVTGVGDEVVWLWLVDTDGCVGCCCGGNTARPVGVRDMTCLPSMAFTGR